MLRVLFNSDFFRSEESLYQRMKSPAELVAGILRLTGEFHRPRFEMPERVAQMTFMGQQLANPPSVEGWHQGTEWIDSGTLMERINFATQQLGAQHNPGVRAMIDAITAHGSGVLPPERLVEACLDQLGAIAVSPETRTTLVAFASNGGDLLLRDPESDQQVRQKVADVLQMAAATHDFQRS